MSYRVPAPVLRRLGAAMLGVGSTSLVPDCRAYIDSATPPPVLEGEHNIPVSGPFCAVANHYQRHGLWIGYPSSLLVTAVARRRSTERPLHFAVVDQTRLWRGRIAVPGTAWAYRRVAACYEMVPIPARDGDTTGRGASMRRLARLALPPPRGRGEPICLYPEGERGTARGVGTALPGSGDFLLLLARGGVPTLPVGFAEIGGRLVGRVGEPFLAGVETGTPPAERDQRARWTAMERIAALVPAPLRGPYG